MSLPTALLQTQTSKLFSLPAPLTLSPPNRTLTFPRKTPTLSTSLRSVPSQQQESNANYEDEEEEHVIGDCVVFEEGIFEDPYLQQALDSPLNSPKWNNNNSSNRKVEVEAEDLVPEKWKDVQAEINITKKEKRVMKREMEFGRRVERMRQGLVPIEGSGFRVRVEEYVAGRSEKLVVNDGNERKGGERSERVAPRNPRLGVYGGTLDDITEFFSSGSYDPKSTQNNEGHRKLFTKEEKVLLNRRIPELSAATSDKWQPLHSLAASGEFYLVNALFKHNVDINIKDKDGLTVLHKAVISKKQAIFNYLLRESANPFVRDKDGATLMHYAVRTASSPMIKVLLLYNVDINLQDNDGWTPLHLAVQTRRTDIVRLLLIKGADKTVKAQDGLTPLDLCLYSGQDARTYELIKLMKQLPKPR
ncbi:ankyrin repeat domain-containing protein, chloroplastic [Rhododendron vialii]|uniref:ankyrin repeat domain-containing protein, chloroplastic n=1 Tax=Rhododendron vialii TaxID=182163 RepID=UPI00265DD062|nr:ankyrin repeat domain-containing protein, chloroplastic [Rhododendron vialii]